MAVKKGKTIHLHERTSSTARLSVVFIIVGIVSALLYVLDGYRSSLYQFDPVYLQKLSQAAIAEHGTDAAAISQHIISNLAVKYPSYTINQNFAATSPHVKGTPYVPNDSEWLWNNAGGAMGAMFIIHASLTEYLIIFGTPMGTEGHSGRHTADDYFTILAGVQQAAFAGAFEMETYPAGSQHHLRRGQVKQYRFAEGGWALELAQGYIPLMLPFGFADTFFSTLDFPTLYHTIRITAREMITNLLHGKI